ncbi:hypothetical protein [Streptomyces phaeochromogenes]|uniref:hypothetical protein n=1 Tax=Streptomyces phaeochromogenes TaxID=1923 RepID=UPI0027D86BA2|nr:hypothetical protein [Streptomyces phaeochromogenes]
MAVTSGLAGADRVSVTVMRAPVTLARAVASVTRVSVTVMRAPVTGTRVSVGVARAVGPVVVR